jgi:hypothetical protein
MHQPKHNKRKRGVILTPQGWNKLQQAKSEAELEENSGYRYTLEALSERTGLSVDTVLRVNNCSAAVDKQTLMRYFNAFNLVLEDSDYDYPEPRQVESKDIEPELPESQMPYSEYDVERPFREFIPFEAMWRVVALAPLFRSMPQSMFEGTISSQPEKKQAKSEAISPCSNSFNISNSTIKNVSGSGTINYYETPGGCRS